MIRACLLYVSLVAFVVSVVLDGVPRSMAVSNFHLVVVIVPVVLVVALSCARRPLSRPVLPRDRLSHVR